MATLLKLVGTENGIVAQSGMTALIGASEWFVEGLILVPTNGRISLLGNRSGNTFNAYVRIEPTQAIIKLQNSADSVTYAALDPNTFYKFRIDYLNGNVTVTIDEVPKGAVTLTDNWLSGGIFEPGRIGLDSNTNSIGEIKYISIGTTTELFRYDPDDPDSIGATLIDTAGGNNATISNPPPDGSHYEYYDDGTGGAAENYAGAILTSALTSLSILGEKRSFEAQDVNGIGLTLANGLKYSSGWISSLSASFSACSGTKSNAGNIGTISTTTSVISAKKDSFGGFQVQGFGASALTGSSLEIRLGSIIVQAIGVASASGNKSTTGIMSSAAQDVINIHGSKSSESQTQVAQVGLSTVEGSKLSFSGTSIISQAFSTLRGYSDSASIYIATFSLLGVLTKTVLRGTRQKTVFKGRANAF